MNHLRKAKLSNLGAFLAGVILVLVLFPAFQLLMSWLEPAWVPDAATVRDGQVAQARTTDEARGVVWHATTWADTYKSRTIINATVWCLPITIGACVAALLARRSVLVASLVVASGAFLFFATGTNDYRVLLGQIATDIQRFNGLNLLTGTVLLLAIPLPFAWLAQNTIGFRRPPELAQR